MNYRVIARTLGTMLIINGVCMLPSAGVAIILGDDTSLCSFFLIAFLVVMIGMSLKTIKKRNETIRIREGYLIVVLSWMIFSFFSAMPYILSGAIPNFFDAIFEATSGITTTGSSILSSVEALPAAMQFWRGFTHWMGGLGILTMAIAILPALGIGGFQMAKAEASNTNIDKTAPKMTDMAKILYKTYFALTIACLLLLMLGGMNIMDACANGFSAISTGGFSNKDTSIGYFNNPYIEIILSIFMIIGSISFPVIYAAFTKKRVKVFLKNEEVRYFFIILLSGAALVTLFLYLKSGDSLIHCIRKGFFHSVSVMTTTGFCTTDYNVWPAATTIILLLLAFCGGCSGSTAGGAKVIRILILLKLIVREFKRKLHPKAVYTIKVKKEITGYDTAITASTYLIFLFLISLIGAVVVSLNPEVDLMTAFSASIASVTNLGPGFSLVGPVCNFGFLNGGTKLFLSFLMVVGKLEIFAVLILFTPAFWNPDRYR